MFCKINSILIQTRYTIPAGDTPAMAFRAAIHNKTNAQKRFAVQACDATVMTKELPFGS
ncbi:MAG: hypothetical protein ABJB86_05245 [Bacteroidota bacterium]